MQLSEFKREVKEQAVLAFISKDTELLNELKKIYEMLQTKDSNKITNAYFLYENHIFLII